MTVRRPGLLLAALLLTACHRSPAANTLEQQLIFTANGTFDAQADHRDRLPGGLRSVVWTTHPPLQAAAMTITYDGDSRAQAWNLIVEKPTFSAQDAAGAGAATVQTAQGPALRPAATSGLKDVLVLRAGEALRLVTRGYAAQRDPDLLSAFR
ncbi:hypothetical protein HNQ07_000069 [Deinococcus metalli]|uniref:Uncharacterized protein n=1 Tax=Deinococcus metalli TaxID=1141878 RepID=A0A7W8KB09_9DEIO|nr:hypothetical protein [Deinococcus metalli]MBB5374625.1 hypothetical protein [Deinococcus metalli]GHF34916.1 hypothetical protein GCM10017781_09720 [Deinococcus metalli]